MSCVLHHHHSLLHGMVYSYSTDDDSLWLSVTHIPLLISIICKVLRYKRGELIFSTANAKILHFLQVIVLLMKSGAENLTEKHSESNLSMCIVTYSYL